MKSQATLTKAQALAGLLAEQRAEELDMICSAMTADQITAAIEAEGISRDQQAVYFARQDERIRAAIARQPAPENVVPIRKDVAVAPSKKKPWYVPTRRDVTVGGTATVAWFVIRAVMVAAEAAPAALPLVATGSGAPVTIATGAAAPVDPGTALREQAFIACGKGHFDRCLQLLDQARGFDPNGEHDADVIAARKLAEESLRK